MRTRTLAALLVVLSVTTAGCVATGQTPPGEATTEPSADAPTTDSSPFPEPDLNSRLVVTGADGVETTVTVSVRNVTAGNSLVLEDEIHLAGESRDLSPLFRPESLYSVSITTDGTTRQYLVSGGQGLEVYVGDGGVVQTDRGAV
jgi:hypothetical protein